MSQTQLQRRRRGLLLVISSPSGAGKTTLSRRLLQDEEDLVMSISVTTRNPRPGEQDGKDYFFVSREQFQEMRAGDQLLEWAEVFENFYGTPRGLVERALARGRDVLFDIDWQGSRQLEMTSADDLVRIFLLPPSLGDLATRLRSRAGDPEEVITHRMNRAAAEIQHWAEYDYVIVNDDLETAFRELKAILHAERLKRRRQVWLNGHVESLIRPRS